MNHAANFFWLTTERMRNWPGIFFWIAIFDSKIMIKSLQYCNLLEIQELSIQFWNKYSVYYMVLAQNRTQSYWSLCFEQNKFNSFSTYPTWRRTSAQHVENTHLTVLPISDTFLMSRCDGVHFKVIPVLGLIWITYLNRKSMNSFTFMQKGYNFKFHLCVKKVNVFFKYTSFASRLRSLLITRLTWSPFLKPSTKNM